MNTTRRTAGVHSRKRPLGPNGEKICYNCGGPLPKGKPFNCSSKCSEEWTCRTSPSILRGVLKRRDKGICAACGVDTEALEREYKTLSKETFTSRDGDSPRARFLKEHGIPWSRSLGDWWDADHIVPVIEGGGECGLDNYRTLCIPCHAKETRELAARRAKVRREVKREQRDADRGLLAGL